MPNGKRQLKVKYLKILYLQKVKQVAKSYGKDFYSGDIAKSIVSFIKSQGGYLELEDLKNYKAE